MCAVPETAVAVALQGIVVRNPKIGVAVFAVMKAGAVAPRTRFVVQTAFVMKGSAFPVLERETAVLISLAVRIWFVNQGIASSQSKELLAVR